MCVCFTVLHIITFIDFMLIPILEFVIYREIMIAPVNLLCCKITI